MGYTRIRDFLTYKETDSASDFTFRMSIIILYIWIISSVLGVVACILTVVSSLFFIVYSILFVLGLFVLIDIMIMIWIAVSLIKGNGVE